MKRISPEQLRDELINHFGESASMIRMVTSTPPDMRVKGNPHRDALKISEVRGIINFQYARSVINRRERLAEMMKAQGKGNPIPDFRQGESWHKPLEINGKLTPISIHKAGVERGAYLRIVDLKTKILRYEDPNGVIIPAQELEPFLRPAGYNDNQGLPRHLQLRFRVVNINNIKSIRMYGEEYEIV